MSKPNKLAHILGFEYENLVVEKYLKRYGLKFLTRNYKCRFGEIDLIMTHSDILVFVEVRARQNPGFGSAIETVDYFKQKKIIKTAQNFMQKNENLKLRSVRFDVIGINNKQEFTWIQNAFTIDE